MITNEELAAWLAGEADPAVTSQVESALPDDPALVARIDRIRAADSLLAAMPASPPPADAAVQRITAAAMRAASDHLDLEAAGTAETGARGNRGTRLGGAMGRAGIGTSGGREPQTAAYAGSSDDTAGWLGRIDWSGWPVRLAAAVGVVALVGVGFGVERLGNVGERQDLGTVAADEMADQAGAEALPPERDGDARGEVGSDEFAAATAAATASAPENAPENAPVDASGNASVESFDEELAQGQTGDGAEAGNDQSLSAVRPLDSRVSDGQWAEAVADGVPTILSAPAGDVALLTIGKRFESLIMTSEIDTQGRDKSDNAFRSPSLQVSSTTVQQWIDGVTPTATTIDSNDLDTTDDVRTGPELARDCVARRSLAVADVVPAAPDVVAVLTGVGQGNAGRLHALVDADGGIVVVDAATCDPA